MRVPMLNLAKRPFTNSRPIARLALVLWLVGGVLLAINGWRYWQLLSGSEHRGQELETLAEQVQEHRERIADLKRALNGYDVAQQNAQVTFLNQKIAGRTFGWSELFDRLEEVLPDDVRLASLSPINQSGGERRRARKRDGEVKDRFILQLRGTAKTFDAELALLDRLFEHPSFSRPRLSRDALNKVNQVEFEISVVYRPGPLPAGTPEITGEAQALAESGAAADDTTTAPAAVAAPVPNSGGGGGRRSRTAQPPVTPPPVVVAGGQGSTAGIPEAPRAASETSANGLPPGLVGESQTAGEDETQDSSPRRDALRRHRRNRTSVPSPSRPATATSSSSSQQTSKPSSGAIPVGVVGTGATPVTGGGSTGGTSAGGSGSPSRPSPTTPVPQQPSASSALEPR